MKKICLLLFAIVSMKNSLVAQNDQNFGSITGTLIENNTGNKLKDVAINLKGNSNIKIMSDGKGNFKIPINNSGIYQLICLKDGFLNKQIDSIVITNSHLIVDLGVISLIKKSIQLNEIVIASKKNTIEVTTEKTIYNVENDVSSQNGNAVDILKKMPQIAQNADGGIELMGNASIQYLVDGKPSTMFNGNSVDALQSIPASQIQKIEVISNPSSKYDATGAAGVVNIILKKSKVEGYTFFMNCAIGSRIENGTLNANYNHKKISTNIMLGGNQQLTGNTPSGSVRNIENLVGQEKLIQDNNAQFGRSNLKFNSSILYKIDEKNELQLTYNLNQSFNKTVGIIHQYDQQFLNSLNILVSNQETIRNSESNNQQYTQETNLKYTKRINSKGDNISFLFLYSDSYNESYYFQLQKNYYASMYSSGSKSWNPGHFKELNTSIDYYKQLAPKYYFESGIKYIKQLITSTIDSKIYDSLSQSYHTDVKGSNYNTYQRDVIAGYLQFSKTINKNELKLGMRYEYTISKPWFSNNANNYHNEYGNLAPSLLLAHKFNDHNFIKFSYAYRIERPDYKDLNPFYNLSDPHNITTGNPLLKTEIGNNFELSYNKVKENAYSYTIILFCQYNSPDIKPYISYYNSLKIGDSIYQNVTLTTRGNISAETRYGINASAGIEIQKKWSIRPSVQLFNRHLVNLLDTPSILNGIGFRTNLNISYKLNQTWNAEIFGNYNLGMRWQGQQASNYSYTFAIRKQVAKSGMSFGLVAVNLFNPYIHQVSITDTRTIQMTSFKDVPYRSIGLSFSIKLGTLKVSKIKEGDNYLLSPPEN
jgi:ferric enterobactin receptor